MALVDDIEAKIADIDQRILFLQASRDDEIARLQAERAQLVQAQARITPQLENAIRVLKRLGLI